MADPGYYLLNPDTGYLMICYRMMDGWSWILVGFTGMVDQEESTI